MEDHSVGYVPNLSARIGETRSSMASHPVYAGNAGGMNAVQTFDSAFTIGGWFAMSFDFSRSFGEGLGRYSYAGFSVSNLEYWTGMFQTIGRGSDVLISDWSFELVLRDVYSTNYAFTFMAIYDPDVGTMSLSGEGFEEIEI